MKSPVEILARQTQDAYNWLNRLISPVPYNQWENTPEIIESNISWQVGHLVLSHYFHAVMVIVGHQKDILQQVPMREYDQYFTHGIPKKSVGKASPEQLHNHLQFIQQRSIEIIQSLTPDDLEHPLVPTPVPHPVASNKFEALDWNVKHTMWHCGQLGLMKRVVHERFDFGLQRQ
ncbi:MAG TPA: DinB family protein [Ohtaekwangia sp.]|uniref:DinB family protein n=1 Tax=Ohtaekwangia sp. TaxID=2066019 RepID=UPI002F9288C1